MRPTHEPSGTRIGEDEIHAFVDDVLDDSRRNELLAYIAAHPHEAERVNAYFRQRTALESLRSALVDDDDTAFCPDMQRRLSASLTRQHSFRVFTRMAAAIAVMLPLGLGSWFAATHFRQPASGDTVATNVSIPEFPFGGSFETASVGLPASTETPLDVLARHLGGSSDLVVPDLEAIGLSLIGGDAVPGVNPPAARLVYGDELGHQLLVFVGIASSEAQQALALVPEGHLSLNWRSGPLVFAVVGPMDMPKLQDVMRLVSDGITEVADVPDAPEVTADATPTEIDAVVLPDPTDGSEATLTVLPTDEPVSEPILQPVEELGKELPKTL